MSLWVLLAVGAYLLNAINGVMDKFLLTGPVRHPIAYAFFTGITSFFILLAVPFGVRIPTVELALISLASGVSFTFALYFLYAAIQQSSVSRVLPIQGGLVPVFTLLFAHTLVDERLTFAQYAAFGVLVVGAFFISIRKNEETGKLRPQAFFEALAAAVFFALSFAVLKYVFENTNFLSGFVWTSVAKGLGALVFLFVPVWRKQIFDTGQESTKGNRFLFYSSRAIGALGSLMENLAIALGSVTIVKALQGTQYVFLLLLTSFLTLYFPKILHERITMATVAQKVIGIIFITSGLALLYF